MGQTGKENHGMLVSGGAGKWTASCPHSGDGVLVRGGTFLGSVQHGGCSATRRMRDNFGTRVITLLPGWQTVELLCAHNNRAHWSYASSTGLNEMDSEQTTTDADVLVVGAGLGGHAAAVSISVHDESGTTQAMYTPSGGSTTSRSTGVVWFPLNHTLDELMQASGAGEASEDHLQKYIELGTESKTFWESRLQLGVYRNPFTNALSPDYTQYSSGGKRGNSFQHVPCLTQPTGDECGSQTLQYMEATYLDDGTVKEGYNVVGLTLARTGFRARYTYNNQELHSTFRAVIFANGGSGRFSGFADDRILASAENTGIHMRVANAMGMTLNSNRNLSWGLEFQQTGPGGNWTEKWFSFGCAPDGVAGYKKCGDYNTRTLSWPDHTPRNSTVANVSTCAAESDSYSFWDAFMTSYNQQILNLTATASELDAAACSNPQHRLATGMIDGKDGFITNPETMESVDVPGIYAVGTAGSYGLGNTYFGPGATLGWALHSGRLAGKAAVAHVAKEKRREKQDLAVTVKAKRKKPMLVRGFRWGSWLLLAAVALHMFGNLHKLAAWAHYALAPTAVAVLLATAWQAQGQHKKDRMMQQLDSSKSRLHSRMGMAVTVLLAVQVGFGVAALVRNSQDARSTTLSTFHRISGWTILVLVAGLYWTSIETAPLYDDNRSKREAEGEAGLYGSLVVAFGAFALAIAVTKLCQKLKSQRNTERTLLFAFG